jgi:hypothetical protein
MRIDEILSLDPRRALKMEYWALVEKQPGVEIWRHRDDPSIGEYKLIISPDNNITQIDYTTPMHKMFSQSFTTFREFLTHLRGIMDDDDPPEDERGLNILRDIANKLKKNNQQD